MNDERRRILCGAAAAGRTPASVCVVDDVRAQAGRGRSACGDPFRLGYTIESHLHTALLGTLRGGGGHVDASSIGEGDRAIFAGHVADRVTFYGPARRDHQLRRALERLELMPARVTSAPDEAATS